MIDLKDLFVPYELALKLKIKGFDDLCLMGYNEEGYLNLKVAIPLGGSNPRFSTYHRDPHIKAPLYQQVVDWFLTKGVVIRLNEAGDGYQVRAKEWEENSFVGTLKQDDAIIESLKLIPDFESLYFDPKTFK